VRPASRVARLVALWLVAVTLSIGWLLLRRRTRQGPLLRAVPDLPADAVRQPPATLPAEFLPAESPPAEPQPAEPRRPQPVSALRRPVHDTAEAAQAATAPAPPAEAVPVVAAEAVPAVAAEARPAEPEPVPDPAVAAEPEPVVDPAAAAEPEPVPDPGMAPEPAPPDGFVAEPEQADDLRRIRGIGRAIESSLHGLGIRSYRQLVMLDEAGLDRVRDAGRDFRQRIEREDWIGQARQLHREKYGEEV